MAYVTANDILGGLKTRLESLTMGTPAVPTFEQVSVYQAAQLVRALQDLRGLRGRVCLIVPDGDAYTHTVLGRVMVSQCTRRVLLLLTDRHIGTLSADQVDVLEIDQSVIASLTGDDLDLTGVRIEPVSSEPISLTDEERANLPWREGWILTLNIVSGNSKTAL
jgi:hypothetical protein